MNNPGQDSIQAELAKIDAAIAAQENLRGILPEAQLEAALAALRSQRQQLLNPGNFHLTGDDATVAQQRDLGQAITGGEFEGDVLGPGSSKTVIVVAETFWQQYAPTLANHTPADLQTATERYLRLLLDRYRYLDFKGMGVSDRVALRMPLLEMYVPLKARIELPEGETWSRHLWLAGRPVTPEEAEAMGHRLSDPQPLLELLSQQAGLIILGDPGAGKTTFLKYLTLRLALGQGQELGLGRRLPILVPLSAYANALEKKDIPLDEFVVEYFQGRGIRLPLAAMLAEALEQGGALLLLDGLDEVRNRSQRQIVVDQVVDFFNFQRRRGNKFVLTSRIVGYRDVRPPVVEGLVECTLVDFDGEEISQFVTQWTGALERAHRGDTPVAAEEAAQERADLLDAMARNPGVRQLAANPLLLTILALMKRQGVTLPERRVELYQKYVETLLRHWNLVRGLGRPPARDLDVVETLRVLAPLALWMHQTSPGVGLVKRHAVRRELEAIYRRRKIDEPEQAARQLLADAREYASLLLERGAGAYGFIHLTFQEYLAGIAIAQQGQQTIAPVVTALAAHIDDDSWHEVSLLTVGYLGIVQQRDEAAGAVLQALIEQAPGEAGQAVVLSGEAVLDAWPGGVPPACKTAIVEALLKTMVDDRVALPLRTRAGQVLGLLGDPRDGVTTLPPLLTQPIGGRFLYGQDKAERETAPFQAGIYPVTNAQFAGFVEAGGYENPAWWSRAGWQRRQDKNWTEPRYWNDSQLNNPNQPVVGISWYEAEAFCLWLTATSGREFRLPTEEEWERLARGTDGREYPWGDGWRDGISNTSESDLNQTTAVGLFPQSRSLAGAGDCAGNVWEWCLDWYDERKSARVLRGGSWSSNRNNARCAYRYWGNPYLRSYFGFRVVSPSF